MTVGAILCKHHYYEEAKKHYLEALETFTQQFGAQDGRCANVRQFLGNLYRDQQPADVAEAEKHYQQAMNIREKIFGSTHPDFAESMSSLARLYEENERPREAKEQLETLLRITEALYGSESEDYQQARARLVQIQRITPASDELWRELKSDNPNPARI